MTNDKRFTTGEKTAWIIGLTFLILVIGIAGVQVVSDIFGKDIKVTGCNVRVAYWNLEIWTAVQVDPPPQNNCANRRISNVVWNRATAFVAVADRTEAGWTVYEVSLYRKTKLGQFQFGPNIQIAAVNNGVILLDTDEQNITLLRTAGTSQLSVVQVKSQQKVSIKAGSTTSTFLGFSLQSVLVTISDEYGYIAAKGSFIEDFFDAKY